ncbi:MAG: hypothetical protein R3B90_23625 [Planctomycetaceae bacterium]
MIDWMAEDGVVGDYNGSKCREVICTYDDWLARQDGELIACSVHSGDASPLPCRQPFASPLSIAAA